MMIATFSIWNNRVAPVFDVARQLLIVEADSGHEIKKTLHSLPVDGIEKVDWLTAAGIEVFVCGAISRFLEDMLESRGIQILPFIAGDTEEIVRCWLKGNLTGNVAYAMPGCRRRRCMIGSGPEKEPASMHRRRCFHAGAGVTRSTKQSSGIR